jgi:hypothetical protein
MQKKRHALLGNPSVDEIVDEMEALECEARRAAPSVPTEPETQATASLADHQGMPLIFDVLTCALEEIRCAGIKVLARELGAIGMVRFLQQFDSGAGDYTRDRHQWLGSPTVDELFDRINRRQQHK